MMRALIDEASEELVNQLRQMALVEGAILQHISIACFTGSNTTNADPRSLVLRQLSRQLIALWTDNNPQAQDLLKRVFVSYYSLFLFAYFDLTRVPFPVGAIYPMKIMILGFKERESVLLTVRKKN